MNVLESEGPSGRRGRPGTRWATQSMSALSPARGHRAAAAPLCGALTSGRWGCRDGSPESGAARWPQAGHLQWPCVPCPRGPPPWGGCLGAQQGQRGSTPRSPLSAQSPPAREARRQGRPGSEAQRPLRRPPVLAPPPGRAGHGFCVVCLTPGSGGHRRDGRRQRIDLLRLHSPACGVGGGQPANTVEATSRSPGYQTH